MLWSSVFLVFGLIKLLAARCRADTRGLHGMVSDKYHSNGEKSHACMSGLSFDNGDKVPPDILANRT